MYSNNRAKELVSHCASLCPWKWSGVWDLLQVAMESRIRFEV
uniref:Uncharacterized protein n=1 Tax=Arundo donax TaxID=35708 RepID=A0A0A9F5F2_ARUDO